ncbi:hypothetical protein GOBAR_DD06590 [Gossypium barbadense]|nr:hypothetical protein GOBAR_DD06590 [Gossypium barbadense]
MTYFEDVASRLYMDEQANLSATGDEAWRDKEAAVLALGVTARGCINGLYPRLSEIVASLIPLLDHKFTLIRSTSCWTLSQFSKYIVQEAAEKLAPIKLETQKLSCGAPPNVNQMRFQPNLVISGGEPYVEDGWRNLRIGNTYFSVTCVEEKAVLSLEAYILLYAK